MCKCKEKCLNVCWSEYDLMTCIKDKHHEGHHNYIVKEHFKCECTKMKYRKKPIVVEAEQWFPNKKIEGVITVERGWDWIDDCEPYIMTLEGKMKVSEGDWIITGIEGEKYPCKDSIFQATYECAG